jgi:hypothetical protein
LAPIVKKDTAPMAKTKTLNGLSYSLAHSYFSTINYYSKGYMSDWIVNSAFDIGIDGVQIDILNKVIFPKELMIRPLLINLDYLKHIIDKTLKSNNLPLDFIKEAKFDIKVTKDRQIICSNFTIGENGRIYKSKDYIEQSYEKFPAINPSTRQIIQEKANSIIGRFRFFLWRKFKIGQLGYTKRIENRMN